MTSTIVDGCIAVLADTPPVLAVLASFVIGYVIVGVPVHWRAGGIARDIWGTAAGLCAAAIYTFCLANVLPQGHHILATAPTDIVKHEAQ